MKTIKFVLGAFSIYALMGLLFTMYFNSKGDAQIIAEEKIPIDPNQFFTIYGIALVSVVLVSFIVLLGIAINKVSVPVQKLQSRNAIETNKLTMAA